MALLKKCNVLYLMTYKIPTSHFSREHEEDFLIEYRMLLNLIQILLRAKHYSLNAFIPNLCRLFVEDSIKYGM